MLYSLSSCLEDAYFQNALTILPYLATICNPQDPKLMYPLSSSKYRDDYTKHSELIISIIILHTLSVICALISPLPQAYKHRTISYRAVQILINHPK